ncbi:hypothetical protein DFH09DRAFT_929371 [Mycena vulgaris]|nr:hypothetical protein DFH09DRAFT_929371 [Mycena vulgaris]
MTDYASQGKSRPKNVVHLNHCRDHKAYYVALCRGTSAKHTVIIEGFDAKKITSGMNGYLRQELRELEILDEITRLCFEDLLPRTVTGIYRGRLITTYRAWKGKVTAEPAHFHPAIRWNTSIDGRDPQIVYGAWKPTIKKGPSASNAQSKREAETTLQQPPPKKVNRTVFAAPTSVVASAASSTSVIALPGPTGLIWDSTNYSCAYDSLFTTLANIWRDNPADWTQRLVRSNALLGLWALSMTEKQDPSEHSRDAART